MFRSSCRFLGSVFLAVGPLGATAFAQQLVAPPTPTVSVSSQSTSTSQLGIKAIDGVVDGWPGDYTKEWASFGQLSGAWIRLTWASAIPASEVILYDRINTTDNILSGTLSFSDGSTLPVGPLPASGPGLLVSFSAKTITWVQFTVNSAQGSNIGLAEIQVYGPSSQTPGGVIASSLTLNPASVAGGSTSQGTVNLSAAAPSGGAVVLLSSSNPTVGSVAISVTVPAGQTSASFTINTATVGSSSSATISAAYGGVSRPSTLTITPQTTGTDLALGATVTDSSENASQGQQGTKAIDGVIDGYPGDYTKEWATVGQLAGAWIQLNWSNPVQVARIILWDRPNLTDNIRAGTLSFSDGSTLSVGQVPNDARSGYVVSFPVKTISFVKFTITQAVGSNIGLAEFQAFATAGAPVISGVQVSASSVAATVSWATDQLTTGRVDYGLSNTYGSFVSDSSAALTHSLNLASLACNTLYHYRITATGQTGSTSSTPDATFTTGPCGGPGGTVSDDFHGSTLNTGRWSFYAACCGFVKMSGTDALLVVPSNTNHNIYDKNQGVGLFQPSANVDFEVETKFDSAVKGAYQEQGMVVQQNATNFIYFAVYHDGTSPRLLAVSTIAGTPTTRYNSAISSGGAPFWLRIRRSGNTWTQTWSLDGRNYVTGAVFTQALTVTAVGPVAGNAVSGSNPAPGFTAQVDYFFNTAAPISPADGGQPLPPSAPVINVWYGDNQSFGQIGNPQTWVNVVGNVSAPSGISSITYSLNGGPEQSLWIGQNRVRLVDAGDFNAEIAYSSLISGANTVRFTATARNGSTTQRTVTVNYVAGRTWPSTYSINWANVTNIQSVAQIVDGQWVLQNGAVRTAQAGYDRLFGFGDLNTWTNLLGTAEITINSLDCNGFAVGPIVGWTGHTTADNGVIKPDQPRTGHPFPADFVYTEHGLAIGSNSSQTPETTLVQSSTKLALGVKYVFKFQVTSNASGGSHFSFKVWQAGTTEPSGWQLQADDVLSRGSVLIAAHRADITVGNVSITPLP
jgi:hypothetical protein